MPRMRKTKSPSKHLPFSVGVYDISNPLDLARLRAVFEQLIRVWQAAGETGTKVKIRIERLDE